MNTALIRSKRRVIDALALDDDIEDILVVLGKQYHLIRPLRVRPEVFFYLVLDRSRANLALTRVTLSDVEGALQL